MLAGGCDGSTVPERCSGARRIGLVLSLAAAGLASPGRDRPPGLVRVRADGCDPDAPVLRELGGAPSITMQNSPFAGAAATCSATSGRVPRYQLSNAFVSWGAMAAR